MPISRDRYRDGYTWDDWVDRLGDDGASWRARFDEVSLGELRAEYESVPTPRYVACLFDPASPVAREVVPIVARCCDQAGVAGGVDFRVFPTTEFRDLAPQYLADGGAAFPVCVIHDADWVQVGLWRYRPDSIASSESTRHVASGFLDALRGLRGRPWRGRRAAGGREWSGTESSPGAP